MHKYDKKIFIFSLASYLLIKRLRPENSFKKFVFSDAQHMPISALKGTPFWGDKEKITFYDCQRFFILKQFITYTVKFRK